jgi:hypothetical protein
MPGINIAGTKSRNAWESTEIRMNVTLENGAWYRVTGKELPNSGGTWWWSIQGSDGVAADGDAKNERGARAAAMKAMRKIAAAARASV